MQFILSILLLLSAASFAQDGEVIPVLSDSALYNFNEEAIFDSAAANTSDSLEFKPPVEIVKQERRGLVLSALTSTPIEGAVIKVFKEDTLELITDVSGLFLFPMENYKGYSLSIAKDGYETKNSRYPEYDGQTIIEYKLDKPIKTLSKMQVKKSIRGGSLISLLEKRQAATGMFDAMGSEQIGKSTDSDAGAVAKRISGTSLIGGKYVFVRGLGERYTNMYLNGLPVPSPEKDKRIVPQDLFPASALETFTIYKTFQPELPPDFAGGSIDLNTKGIPEKNAFKIQLGLGGTDYYGDGSFLDVGDDRFTYDGGSKLTNYFGYDDGTRAVPNGVPTSIPKSVFSNKERADFAYQFNNKLALDTGRILPNQSFALSYAKVSKGDENKKGMLLDISYSNKYSNDDFKRIVYKPSYSLAEEVYYVKNAAELQIGEGLFETKISALANFGYESKDNQLWFKNLYAHLTEDKAFYNQAWQTRGGPGAGMDSDWEERFELMYSERHFLSNQFGGGHYIGKGILDSLSWAMGFAWTKENIPDKKRYYYTRNVRYVRTQVDTVVDGISYEAGEEIRIIDPRLKYELKSPYGTRAYEVTWEYGLAGRMDGFLVIPPSISQKDSFFVDNSFFHHLALPKAQFGYIWSFKQRTYDVFRYNWDGMQSNEYIPMISETGDYSLVEQIHDPEIVYRHLQSRTNGFETTPNENDSYNAWDLTNAIYLKSGLDFSLGRFPTGLHAGVKAEWFLLDFVAPFTGEASINNPELRMDEAKRINSNEFQLYPSVYWYNRWTKNTKGSFQYARTVIRPEIRERSPTEFYDTEKEQTVVGNPDLVNTVVHNFDYRWDWYLKGGQILSASLFYKNFKDPVEGYVDPNSSPPYKRFQNSKKAFVKGIEFDWLLKPGFIFENFKNLKKPMEDFELSGNVALMTSEVKIDSNSGFVGVLHTTRPMVGQSDFLINAKLVHQPDLGKWSIQHGIAYNVFGPRIEKVGTYYVDDHYENSFHSLDYFNKITIGPLGISLKIKNLLNSRKLKYLDGLDEDEKETIRKTIEEKADGTSYSLSVGYSF